MLSRAIMVHVKAFLRATGRGLLPLRLCLALSMSIFTMRQAEAEIFFTEFEIFFILFLLNRQEFELLFF